MEQYFEYDVGLSFAGEQRQYVEDVAEGLKGRGIRAFYDKDKRTELWGKNLYDYLSDVFQNSCKYCVIFVSKEYADKVWPNLELKSAQARALKDDYEYILPARFDDTPISGLLDTVDYMDLSQMTPQQLCDEIANKLGKQLRERYMPPVLDRLHERLDISGDAQLQGVAEHHARSFFDILLRMTIEERGAVLSMIRFGCPADLPRNVHMNADLLSRYTGIPKMSLLRVLGQISPLGFDCTFVRGDDHETDLPGDRLGDTHSFYLNWVNLSIGPDHEFALPALVVAAEMIAGATENFCEEHGTSFLERLDFSQLANVTASVESHEPNL